MVFNHAAYIEVFEANRTHLVFVGKCMGDLVDIVFSPILYLFMKSCYFNSVLVPVGTVGFNPGAVGDRNIFSFLSGVSALKKFQFL